MKKKNIILVVLTTVFVLGILVPGILEVRAKDCWVNGPPAIPPTACRGKGGLSKKAEPRFPGSCTDYEQCRVMWYAWCKNGDRIQSASFMPDPYDCGDCGGGGWDPWPKPPHAY